MSIKWHDVTVAGTPEVSTVVQAGDNRPVTSSAVKSALPTVIVSSFSGNQSVVGTHEYPLFSNLSAGKYLFVLNYLAIPSITSLFYGYVGGTGPVYVIDVDDFGGAAYLEVVDSTSINLYINSGTETSHTLYRFSAVAIKIG